MIFAVVFLTMLGAALSVRSVRHEIVSMLRRTSAVQTFFAGKSSQAELTLEQHEIYALQLGVFTDGARALAEAERLKKQGIRCIIWQHDQMRIISAVALSRHALDTPGMGAEDGYIIREVLPAVSLRLEAESSALANVQNLLLMPDHILLELLGEEGRKLQDILRDTRLSAEAAKTAHPENILYTQLSESLIAWSDLISGVMKEDGEQAARSYAAVTICTLCKELRTALMA